MSANAAPPIRYRFFDNSTGAPLNGGKLQSYAAGTTTPLQTFTDSSGGTPNANPIILDSNGYCDLWLAPGSAYKFVLSDSLNNVLWTKDNITQAAQLDINSNLTANLFIPGFTSTATAAATTTLTVASTQIQIFTGSTTQTVKMPVASTLANGMYWVITNNSSGVVTVQTSGANTIQAMASSSQIIVTCINTGGGTGTASWNWVYNPNPSGGVLPINLGGTNNSGLTVPAGGMFYSDGSKFVNMGAGSVGQAPISAGASAPAWGNVAQFKLYASSQVTTISTAITSSTYGTFSNSPALSFTPTITGTYKVWSNANCYFNTNGNGANQGFNVRIVKTSGTGTLLYENNGQGADINAATDALQATVPIVSFYTLTSGTAYVFDIQGLVSLGNLNLDGRTANGTGGGPFYMFAELCG